VKRNTTYHGSNIDFRESSEVQRSRGFNGYTRIPKLQCVMEPGDILRMPNYWWHTVETLSDGYAIGATLRAPCMPNLTSVGHLLMRLLDKDYYELVQRFARGGRLTDEDVTLKIFEDLDERKNHFNANDVLRR
jgi:ribosomal protein L16 Arg81 hydroxylase